MSAITRAERRVDRQRIYKEIDDSIRKREEWRADIERGYDDDFKEWFKKAWDSTTSVFKEG